MDGQCLARRCLALPLLFLLPEHCVSPHNHARLPCGLLWHGHASCREAVGMAGWAHLIMFANMVIEGLVVRRPKQAHRAEVGIYSTAHKLHLCPAQGVARVEVP